MKKILLALTLFVAVSVNAQVVNHDFETWVTDTIYFEGLSGLPPDTFTCNNPANWTSSNSITGADSIGGIFLVTESNVAHSGSKSIKLRTDSIKVPIIPGFPLSKITIPGFAVNGRVPITPGTLVTSGSVISPVSVKGAGQPCTQKLGKIKGYYNYAPIFNSNTGSNDTCLVWATLRKGNKIIADAIFKSTDSTTGFQAFEADFKYVDCDDPDTLVILLASSVPNVLDIINAASGLKPGSWLLVDSLSYDVLPVNYNFAPIARNDQDTTNKNTAKTVTIKVNDEDCNDQLSGLTLAITTAPVNGTAAVSGQDILYTPNNNFVGIDSFFYTLADGSITSSPGRVRMLVLNPSGINEETLIPVTIYPVPAGNVLNIQTTYNGRLSAKVYDIVGRSVISQNLNSSVSSINTDVLVNGVYALQLFNEKNELVARTKFTVSK